MISEATANSRPMNAEHQDPAVLLDSPPTASQINEFRSLIRQLTGLHFDDWRLDTLQRALLARMSAKAIGRVESYLALFEDSRQRVDELSALLDQITVSESYFFRYPVQFDFLRETALPSLLAQATKGRRLVRIWCAGCSSGEEPYSIALTALEMFGPDASRLVQILATDVSSAAITAARRAEYAVKSLRLLDDRLRDRYFRQVSGNRFALCDAIRHMVLFSKSNLLDDARQGLASWDLIFCRNVLIYFTPELGNEILERLCTCLSDGGYLFVGHSEIVKQKGLVPCRPEGAFVHQKASGQSSPAGSETTRGRRGPLPLDAPIASEIRPVDDAEAILNSARDAFQREDYVRAADQLDRLLQSFPRHLPGTLLRANLHLNLGQHDRSVRECEVALQLDSFSAEAYMLLGMNLQRLSKPELAVAQLRKAAYLSPESCVVQFQLGEAYRGSKMIDHACRAYENALSLLPAASEREVREYSGGFGKTALKTFCEQMIAVCQSDDG